MRKYRFIIITFFVVICCILLFRLNKSISREVEAYYLILEGDFTPILDDECKGYMDYLYKNKNSDGKPDWKYIICDFNSDGVEDLYIQLSELNESALFTFVEGSVKWLYVDAIELNCYTFPLNNGRFVEIYDYWTSYTVTIYEIDLEFNWSNTEQYTKTYNLDYDTLQLKLEEYSDSEMPEEYIVYYYKDSSNSKKEIDKVEWDIINDYINENRISEDEWNDL